jgi:thioredoxin-related protein
VWEQVASQNRSKVDFKKLDSRDSSNDDLEQKYQVKSWPTIIWTDSSGKQLHRGAPMSVKGFTDQLARFK